MKKLYLVDVSSMFFRAFYAIPPLTSPHGIPTNALYGFLSMSIKLLREIKPDYMAFCFDLKEPSFRLGLYPEYKANRSEMPEDLVPQVPYLRKLSEVLGVPVFDKKGFEADDVIGSLTSFGRNQNLEVIIVSGDKDFAQLIGPFVSMYDTMKSVTYDVQGVIDKWGIEPSQMIDYLALVGDSSDNIPGVRGIGPKGAVKLLNEYKSLDGIYENLSSITGKSILQKLTDNKELAYLSKKLVTIECDIDFNISLEQLKLKTIDRSHFQNLMEELGFKSFEKSLFGSQTTNSRDSQSNVETQDKKNDSNEIVQKSSQLNKNQNYLLKDWTLEDLNKEVEPYSDVWAIDTDRGLIFSTPKRIGYLIEDLKSVGSILNSKILNWKGFDLKKIFHSIKVKDPLVIWDSMIAAYIVRAGNVESFEDLYQFYLGSKTPELPDFNQMLESHLQLEQVLLEKLKEVHGQSVLREIELPMLAVLYSMENNGIRVDVDELRNQSISLTEDLSNLENTIHELAGEKFNIASPKQLGDILFKKLGLPTGKKTKTGFSTASDVLEKLLETHPICKHILEYRELAKLKSTYVDSLPLLINAETGKIHTHFRQATTATGRLSSVNPNLQNIPIRTSRGRLVRKAFIASPDHIFLSSDYSQIELRILAHITEDEGLISAFKDNLDIHSATASQVFGVKLSEVDSELRRRAKAVNFGIAYGQGSFGLAESLGISRSEASEIIKKYFIRFKRVKDYMESTVEFAKSNGYVETIFGRRRYIEELKAKQATVRSFGERAAINAPIQGAASDLVKLAMIQLHQEVSAPMLLQVHDELLFECKEHEVEDLKKDIKQIMEQVTQLKVPLVVNIATGKNWEDAHS